MSAIVNTSLSQSDFLGGILERLNGTFTQVSQLRQSLGNLEIELIQIRNQCENARAAAAASAKGHDGYKNAIIQKVPARGGRPLPVPLQNLGGDRDPISANKEKKRKQREWEDGPTETPRFKQKKYDSKTNPVRKSARLSMKAKAGHSHSPSPSPSPGVSFSSRIPGGSGPLAGHVVKTGNSLEVSRPRFRTILAQPQMKGVAALGSVRKHTKKLPMPIQIPLRPPPRPPTQPSPFPEHIDLSSYPPKLKHEDDDWFVLYNLSPNVKRVLDVNVMHTLMHDSGVACAKFSQNGERLATGCRRTAQIYDVKSGIKTHILDHKDNKYIWGLTFSPDGKYLATGGDNKQITVWDVANQQIHDILKGHQAAVWSLNFSPNGQFIISGSDDGTVRIWDIHDRTFKVLTIDSHYLSPDHRVWSVAISPDGKYVAVGSANTVVSIWEITTGMLVQTLRGHTDIVGSVAFTPDGKVLISGSCDATLKYWDVSVLGIGSGAGTALTSASSWSASSSPCIMNLTGDESYVYSTAVSHDGSCIASGSFDGNVLFWDMKTGMAHCLLSGHKNIVWKVDLSPMGNVLATASDDRRVRIWTYGPSQ